MNLSQSENKKRAPAGVLQILEHSPLRIKVLLAVVVLLIILLVVFGYFYSQVAGVFDPGEAGKLEQMVDADIEANGERFYNLLLVGIDYDADDENRDYANGKGMTDVILYMQIDRDNGKINVLQIPRDTYAGETIGNSSIVTGKLNEVYANGPDQKNRINNLANKLYDLFKLPVDNYVTIDMNAFKTMLNVMGGLDMYVPWDITDKKTGDLLVPQGYHRVSGDTAEVILRNRNYATADYQRLETQQYFYAAVVRTFLEEYKLADYYAACKNLAYYINTDLDITEIWGLYATLTHVSGSDIFVVRAPGGAVPTMNGHTGLFGVDRDVMADLLNRHFRDADMPVKAELLDLYAGWDYSVYGETIDEGRTLGDLNSGSSAEAAAEVKAAG